MRHRYLRQIIYVKGRVLKSWKQTGCPLLFRNSFSLFVSLLHFYTNDAWLGESWRGVRLKPVHLILSKHRPPPLGEAYKQSDIHSYTHTHTIMPAYTYNLQFVWFGIALSYHRARGRRKKTFPGKRLAYSAQGNSADREKQCHCSLGRERNCYVTGGHHKSFSKSPPNKSLTSQLFCLRPWRWSFVDDWSLV